MRTYIDYNMDMDRTDLGTERLSSRYFNDRADVTKRMNLNYKSVKYLLYDFIIINII